MGNILDVLFLVIYSYSSIPCVMGISQCAGVLGLFCLFTRNGFVMNFDIIGNREELDTIYNATILADEKRSADMNLQTQITIVKHSQTLKPMKRKTTKRESIKNDPSHRVVFKASKVEYVITGEILFLNLLFSFFLIIIIIYSDQHNLL
jgi:hypothetical protein